MREAADLIVFGGMVVTMGPGREMLRDAAIAVRDGRIAAIGAKADILGRYHAPLRLGGDDRLVFPGLIDCHNHPIHFLSKGMIDDMRYPDRWRDYVWPYEAGLSPEEANVAAKGTFLEMVRRGTTCFADSGTVHADSVARAAGEVGIRGVISRLTWDVRDPTAPDSYAWTTEQAVERGAEVVRTWNGAFGGRLHAAFSLVRQMHTSAELAQKVKEMADAMGVAVHAHLSTTDAEMQRALQNWGMSPVQRYRELGVLGPRTQLVHMGALTDQDLVSLREFDVSVVHCPSASMFGGFGCVTHGRFPELVSDGVRVVLGTDAAAVSRFLDMVKVMYLAACAHKDVHRDPTVIGAHKAMEMATIDAAKALLWDDEIGSLEVGKRADIVIANAGGIEWQPDPWSNPVGNLVYSADGGCVESVVIDGSVVLHEGRFRTLDEAAFRAEAAARAREIWTRMGAKPRTAWEVN